MVRRISRVGCVVSGALVLGGCGGGGSSSSTTTAPTIVGGYQVAKVIPVHETEFSLRPARIQIDRFGYYGIKAINDGSSTHALSIEGHGLDESSGDVEPGKSKTFAVFFQRAGTYKMYCPIDGHEAQGMRGTVKVH